MTLRTHASQIRPAGHDSSRAGLFAAGILYFLLFVKLISRIAIRLLAAFSLLTAQISASYSNTPDPEQPEPSGRLALVVGNSAYRNVTPLKNPGNDAKLIAETLRGLGFEVIEKTDLTRKGFQAAVDEVAKKAGNYESVLLYYAGHGFQIDGGNYLVPVDSKLRDRKKFASETIELNAIIGKLEGENRNTLILLDACRDNPAKQDSKPAEMSEGLAQMETGNGTFVAFATQPGNITRDGAGDNSPFSIALAEHMQTEGISISDMMIRVRNTVEERTAGEQTPWDQSSLRSQFYFNPVVEATDSLTEEDLALLEQLDPALREKFMKRFGLNLNEDGTAEGEEVVATVTPSLRIEADNAALEDVAAVSEDEQSTSGKEQAIAEPAGVTPATVDDGGTRTAVEEELPAPRKPGLMVLAMPDEEPASEPEAKEPQIPVVAQKAEQVPQTVAMADPNEVVPAIPTPKPAPVEIKPEVTSAEKLNAEKPDETELPINGQGTKPSGDPGNLQSAQSDQQQPVPGSALSDLLKVAPLTALIKESPAKAENTPSTGKQDSGTDNQTTTPVVKAPAIAPQKAPAEAVVASKPIAEPVKPAVSAPAVAKPQPMNPAVTAPDVAKPQPVVPAPVPAPVIAAKPPVPAEPKPAPQTIVALNKPANIAPVEAKPLPVKPKAEIELVPPAVPAAPSQLKSGPTAAVTPSKPAEPDSSDKLVPTPSEAKPSTTVALTPTLPKPSTVVAPTAPAAPTNIAVEPAAPAPIASSPDKAAEPDKPAVSTSQPVTSEIAKATGIESRKNEPLGAGSLLTSTSPAPSSATAIAVPAASNNLQPAKEQLLAMADPAPATKLAPAATEAAATPAPTTEPSAGKFDIPLPGEESDEDKKQLAIKAQKELTRLGCFRNETDGDWGPRSARALLRFYAEQKLEPDQLEPTAELVSRLSSVDKVVCKNTETDRPKQAAKKTPGKTATKTQTAPAKPKAPVAQKVQPKPKPAYKAPPAVAKAPPPAGPKKKINGGALIGAFR